MTHRNLPFQGMHRVSVLLPGEPGKVMGRRRGCRVRALSFLVSLFGIALFVGPAAAQTEPKPPATYPALPSEIPAKFKPTNAGFDYTKRDVMIPMRDGVKLHTVILIPKGAKQAPILLTRTPYDADKLTEPRRQRSPRAGPERLRQRPRRDPRGRLHPRRAGRPRQARLRGRLRRQPAPAGPAEPDPRRSRDRHVGHHRLAGEERPGEQRQGRHPGDLVRRLPPA